jgi:protein-S-isoprenylcysteine O-methyltransferase Ste14
LPTEPLQTGGVYQLVRHPLYLFSLMVIWPLPAMTEAMLGFNIAATIYFTFGSLLEERRLVAIFGQDYITYQQRVPWLIPFIHLRRPGL